ncbi:MAG: ribonuclease HII [Verrucomicrobia bacterium]|nr:ribonuclease HII [Verrucomicrobiota bacterium]
MPTLRYEKKAFQNGARIIAGVDEAGRGPLAGPVVAAAVVLPCEFRHRTLNDSKQLREEQREEIYIELTGRSDIAWAVGISSVEIIEQYNILRATERAMYIAVSGLTAQPDHVLVDGHRCRAILIKQTSIIKGDCKSFSIAAASVIAKVTRDRMMLALDQSYPQYGFAKHKGYGTPEHLAAITAFGPCPIHRRTFAPIRNVLEPVQLDLLALETAADGPAPVEA